MSKTRWLILLLSLLPYSCGANAQDVVLVANRGVRISEIRNADLRDIFLGAKTRFADGSRAVPVTLRGGPAHEVFLKNHVGASPEEFRARWRKELFAGQNAGPKRSIPNRPSSNMYLPLQARSDMSAEFRKETE